MTISATGATVRNALAEARRVAKLNPDESYVVEQHATDYPGIYRCYLADGTCVEVHAVPHTKNHAIIFDDERNPLRVAARKIKPIKPMSWDR
jgi:hypothetical protein